MKVYYKQEAIGFVWFLYMPYVVEKLVDCLHPQIIVTGGSYEDCKEALDLANKHG